MTEIPLKVKIKKLLFLREFKLFNQLKSKYQIMIGVYHGWSAQRKGIIIFMLKQRKL